MRIAPIDVDFAGWTEVELGQHNAFGIIDGDNLLAWSRTEIALSAIAAGSRRVKTAKQAECEASQSGAESASPKRHRSHP